MTKLLRFARLVAILVVLAPGPLALVLFAWQRSVPVEPVRRMGAAATTNDIVVGTVFGDLRSKTRDQLYPEWAPGHASVGPGAVIASGAISAGDGAGGTFVWAPTAPTADDGCTVIVPSGSTGAWVRQWSGALDVRWCGACPTCSATTNTAGINAAFQIVAQRARVYGGATVYLSGTFPISSTVLSGFVDGTFSSISIVGDGPLLSGLLWTAPGNASDAGVVDGGFPDAGVDGLPVASNIALLLWNQYGASLRGFSVQFTNAGANDDSVGIALSGPAESQTTNQVHLDTVTVAGFGTDVSIGGVNRAVGYLDCGAQVLFSNVYINGRFDGSGTGIYGGGNGNSIEIEFSGGGITGLNVGAALGSAGGWNFHGGGGGHNTTASFVFNAEWQGPFSLRDWRFELGAGEAAILGATHATVDGCTFQMSAAPTGANVPITMAGYTYSKVTVRNCDFANNFGNDFPQIVAPSGTTGSVSTIEFFNNRLMNPASVPFYLLYGLVPNGMRYSMFGNYIDGGNQGMHVGTIVDGGMVDSVTSP